MDKNKIEPLRLTFPYDFNNTHILGMYSKICELVKTVNSLNEEVSRLKNEKAEDSI